MPIRRTSDPTWKPEPGTSLNPGHPLTRGLVGCWILNEGGGLIALDSSGYRSNGTLTNGPIWIPGRSGPVVSLDGVDDRIAVGDFASLDIAGPITLVARLAPALLSTQRIVYKASSSQDGYELGLSSTGKAFVRLNQFSSANTLRVDSVTSYPTTGATWVHLAATYDRATIKFYYNGRLEASAAATAAIGLNSDILTLGGESGGGGLLQGKLDEVRIYDRALTAEEVGDAYYAPYAIFQSPSIRLFSVAAATASATLGVSLGATGLAASATATAPASASATLGASLGASSLTASGTVVNPGSATGTLGVSLAASTLAASSTVVDPSAATSTLAVTLGSVTLASSATVVGGSLVARSDDFNRTDSSVSLGTPSDAGSAWEPLIGTWGIEGNKGYNPGVDEHGMAVLESGLSDVDVVATSQAAGGAELWCRVSDASNGIPAGFIAGQWRMYTKIAGGFTELTTAAGSCPAGTVVRLRAEGDQVSLFADNVLILGPITTTFNQSATKHGIGSFTTAIFTYDTFSISAIGSGDATATLAASLGDAILAATGTVVDPDPTAATLAITLNAATLASSATVVDPSPATATLATTLGVSTLTASATVVDPVPASATLAVTLGVSTLAGSATVVDPVPSSATLATSLDAATLVASATVVDPSSADATLAVTLAPTTLSASASGSGSPTLAYAVQAGGLYFAFETTT